LQKVPYRYLISKKIRKNSVFVAALKAAEEISRIRSRIQIQIWIRNPVVRDPNPVENAKDPLGWF
jgi:hypothetical protein